MIWLVKDRIEPVRQSDREAQIVDLPKVVAEIAAAMMPAPDPSLRLKNGYAQDDSDLEGDRRITPRPIHSGGEVGDGTVA